VGQRTFTRLVLNGYATPTPTRRTVRHT